MALDPVLYRTPMLDPKTGGMSREWVRFFDQFAAVIKLLEITPTDLGTAGPGGIENVLDASHGGTGQSSYVNGQILVGRTADNSLVKALLTASDTNVAVTNGPGSIAIGAPNVARKDLTNTFALAQTFSSSVHAQSLVLDNALPVAQGGTGANNAASALAALGGASLSVANTFSAAQTFAASLLTLSNGAAVGAVGNVQLRIAPGGATAGRLSFGTDGTGWSYTIAKNQAGTFTDIVTIKDDLSVTVAGKLTPASLGATSLSGTLNLNAQAISGASLGSITVGRTANFASAAAIWSNNVLNAAGNDNVSLGQSSATYSTGLIQWIGSSNAFIYFNSSQDLRIGSGIGATPIMTFKGSAAVGRVLIGTLTDDTVNKLQVTGGLSTDNLAVTTPANITLGSGWITWTPTFTATGSMTVSGLTITEAKYLRIGPMVFFRLFATMTLGGTASNSIIFTLPVTVAGQVGAYTLNVHAFGANWTPGYGLINNTDSTGRAGLSGEPNYPLGSTIISAEGFYSC